jgi:hypothetical protein
MGWDGDVARVGNEEYTSNVDSKTFRKTATLRIEKVREGIR